MNILRNAARSEDERVSELRQRKGLAFERGIFKERLRFLHVPVDPKAFLIKPAKVGFCAGVPFRVYCLLILGSGLGVVLLDAGPLLIGKTKGNMCIGIPKLDGTSEK